VAVYVPVRASGRTRAVLAWRGSAGEDGAGAPGPDFVANLRTYAGQIGQALERLGLAREARDAQVAAEAERVRGLLLSSVSHDLRTPLAAITGAASGLLESGPRLDSSQTKELLQTIGEESARLNRRLRNILDMTRVQAGPLALDRDWHSLEEILESTLSSLRARLAQRETRVDFPSGLPLLLADASLLEQLLVNLIENAAKYAPPGSAIEIAARNEGDRLAVTVADRGPGFQPGEEAQVFEKFHRGSAGRSRGGTGLGLAIARAIAEAHGGTITAANRAGGGAVLRVEPPVGGQPPIRREPEDAAGSGGTLP
jgi:two-component system sensor histidine kinase KdpD